MNVERWQVFHTLQTFRTTFFVRSTVQPAVYRSVRTGTEGSNPFKASMASGSRQLCISQHGLKKNMGGKKRALPDGGDCEVACAVPAGASARVRRCLAPRLPGVPLSVPENARKSVMAQGARPDALHRVSAVHPAACFALAACARIDGGSGGAAALGGARGTLLVRASAPAAAPRGGVGVASAPALCEL